jgi:hypothetical protein
MPEKNVLDSSYEYLVDAAGEYVTITEEYDLPHVTVHHPSNSD